MQAELIAIGSELVSGRTVNTNAAYLGRRLEELGIPCVRHSAVADLEPLIIERIREALQRSDVILLTGGLGPTFDDLTVACLAQAVERPLVQFPTIVRSIKEFCRRYNRRVTRLALRQALLPRGATALPNPAGTAPGIWLPLHGRIVVAMPGVPHEMRVIMERSVLPRLRRLAGRTVIAGRTLKTTGLVELEIQQVLDTLRIPPQVQCGLYPHLKSVDVRLTVTGATRRDAERTLRRLERALRRRLGDAVYGTDEQTLEEVVGQALLRRRATLAVAESCTGGLIATRITDVPGSSRYFRLGVVAYENAMKTALLDVDARLLARRGAVSPQVARAMAKGARLSAGATYGIGVTGIAGPTGATKTKPAGLVYIALADAARSASKRFLFHGDRLAVKYQASQMALDLLRKWVGGGGRSNQ